MNNELKLSEAMAMGNKIIPEKITFGYYKTLGHKVVASCALGSAMIGKSGKIEGVLEYSPEKLFPCLHDHIKSPEVFEPNLLSMIVEMNDSLDWPREKIVDWLAKNGY